MEHTDMTLWGLFIQADIIVKLVMLCLLIASVLCWGIIIDKFRKFQAIRQRADRFEKAFWASEALDKFYQAARKSVKHPMCEMFLAGMEEWYRSGVNNIAGMDRDTKAAIKERIENVMMVTRNKELEKLEKGLGFLATVGSVAPFVGLFGTVWGIMNSFQSIAVSKNTSLAVVAPGIAEALFATAIGLFAAIPAVMAYNRFTTDLGRMSGHMDDFAVEFETLLSRQLHEVKG